MITKNTNFDNLKALNPEDFTDFVLHIAPRIGREYTSSRHGLIRWLNQPAPKLSLKDYIDMHGFGDLGPN